MHSLVTPDIKLVNVNHRGSWQGALSDYFRSSFARGSCKNILLSIVTFGIYPYKQYKRAKREFAQALAARKLLFFPALQEHIEKARCELVHTDPRQSLNAIFMRVQSEKVEETEEALEFKAIFYPSELLLFITNPTRDSKSIRLRRVQSRKSLDYLKMWHEVKKKARVNQYRQIQSINFCSKMLKEEYCLTPQGIHERLPRTSVYRKNAAQITKFRELGKAFQEILLAHQDFEEISATNPKLHLLIEMLAQTSSQDIKILQTYLTSQHLPKDIPLENRKQLIQLANQQEILFHMSKEEQFNLCALLLNTYQWDFLLSIQEVSSATLGLLDWAFEECSSALEPKKLSFIEKISEGIQEKVKDHPSSFPSISEKIAAAGKYSLMTTHFGKELNREWPSFHLLDGEKLIYRGNKSDALSLEKLIEVYEQLASFSGGKDPLFSLLQHAFSQPGKRAFQSAIEEGVMKFLGTKSEYFLPILSNFDITTVKKREGEFEVRYSFEQLITKKGEVQRPLVKEKCMIICQPLHKVQARWVSPEPTVKIFPMERR